MMSSESNPTQASIQPKTTKKRGKFSQERLMIMFTLFFVVGILLLVLIPEEHAARGPVMGLYSIVVFWAMFRFCI